MVIAFCITHKILIYFQFILLCPKTISSNRKQVILILSEHSHQYFQQSTKCNFCESLQYCCWSEAYNFLIIKDKNKWSVGSNILWIITCLLDSMILICLNLMVCFISFDCGKINNILFFHYLSLVFLLCLLTIPYTLISLIVSCSNSFLSLGWND